MKSAVIVSALLLTLTATTVFAADEATVRSDELRYAVRLRRETRYEEAKPVFLAWLEKHPDDAQAQFDYAYSLDLQATAETDAATAIKLRKEAYVHAHQAQKLGCSDPVLPLVISSIDENGADLKDPRTFSAVPAAAELIKRGEQAYAAGKHDEAFKFYQEALTLDPRAYNASLFSGDAFFSQQKYESAIEWFSKAVEINPNRETAHRYWGDALMKLGRNADARDQYIDALVAEPYNRLPREMVTRFATSMRTPLNRPVVALPRLDVALKDGKIDIHLDLTSGPLVVAYGLGRTKWLTAERGKYFPKDSAPRHSLPEECAGLRAFVSVAADMGAKDPAPPKELLVAAATLKSLDGVGLLEAFVLFDRADAGIAQDYASYRLEHRAELVRYIKSVWFRPEGSQSR